MNPRYAVRSFLKGERFLFRKEWRAAIKGTKMTGRFGRSTWTGKTALMKRGER